MLGLGSSGSCNLPFGLAAHWWERHNGQSKLGYLDWALQNWATLGAEFLSICFALLVVMGLARKLGERWWLPGAAVFVAIGALFTFVSPYLDFTTHPLKDEALLASAHRYESALGVGDIPIRVEKVSDDTDQANAYAYGLGPSRRVVVWDTLLRRPFTQDEQRVVLAHELGHHAQHHLPKGIGWFALFATSRRVDPHASDAKAWRDGNSCRRPSGARRRRRPPARFGPSLERASRGGWRPRPTGRRSRRPETPRRSWADARVLHHVARRPQSAALGAAHARDAPDARRPRRDGAAWQATHAPRILVLLRVRHRPAASDARVRHSDMSLR